MKPDMVYEGQCLYWNGHGRFKATSGLPTFQDPRYQCFAEKGPIPEGTYSIALEEDRQLAQDDGTHMCNLVASSKLQTIPRGPEAGECEPIWANWGRRRIRLTPADAATRSKCKPRRDGFYLHDSAKGYTHGCIEVEGTFFESLHAYIMGIRQHRLPSRKELILAVRYFPARGTNGGTARQ